jgi:hypoxanthine phosphoribosyltransferase
MNEDVEKKLITEEELDRAVTDIAARIDADYDDSGRKLLLLGILKGSVVFMGDLMKKIRRPVEIDFMKVSSYTGTLTRGRVDILLDLRRGDLHNLDIIVVEDIVDSGNTLSYLVNYLKLKGANSVRCATMLDKPSRRKVPFTPDYVGIEIPDYFVVGYGLDYDEKYRTLPYVGVLKPEIYSTR